MAETKEKGIKYLDPVTFNLNYPLGGIINKGSYGIVYASSMGLIVKEFIDEEEEDSFLELVKELNFYASYKHPCILQPLAWTVRNGKGCFAMPRGEDIIAAFNKNKIKFRQIVSDILSAAAFLNSQGIAYCDYKPGNMVYHNGYAKLIDFGIARKATLGPNSQYYVTGLAYTPPYIDPEYYQFQENDIKCEVYALGMALAAIVDIDCRTFGYLSYIRYQDNNNFKWLFSRTGALRKERLSMEDLLNTAPDSLIVRRHTGTLFEEPLVSESKNCGSDAGNIMVWIVQICYLNDYKVETVFLILHLFHRVYFPLIEKYQENDVEDQGYFIAAGVITLAGHIMNDIIITSKQWAKQSIFKDIANVGKRYLEVMMDIMKVTQGILITSTYWDYAKSKEDLLPLLYDVINCKYNARKIRNVNVGLDKCVKMTDIMSEEEFDRFGTEIDNDFMYRTIPADNASVKYPCVFSVKGDVKEVERLWGLDNITTDVKFACVLLRNRFVLHLLELDLALKIYSSLLAGGQSMDKFILDTICKVKWRDELDSIIVQRIHPFKKID